MNCVSKTKFEFYTKKDESAIVLANSLVLSIQVIFFLLCSYIQVLRDELKRSQQEYKEKLI